MKNVASSFGQNRFSVTATPDFKTVFIEKSVWADVVSSNDVGHDTDCDVTLIDERAKDNLNNVPHRNVARIFYTCRHCNIKGLSIWTCIAAQHTNTSAHI